MVENHCGIVPVLNNLEMRIPVGVITDRDITCRTVAKGLNPLTLAAGEHMSTPVATVFPESSLEECILNMLDADVRRVLVVSHRGSCLGIISVSDVAPVATDGQLADLTRALSTYDVHPSHVTAMV